MPASHAEIANVIGVYGVYASPVYEDNHQNYKLYRGKMCNRGSTLPNEAIRRSYFAARMWNRERSDL